MGSKCDDVLLAILENKKVIKTIWCTYSVEYFSKVSDVLIEQTNKKHIFKLYLPVDFDSVSVNEIIKENDITYFNKHVDNFHTTSIRVDELPRMIKGRVSIIDYSGYYFIVEYLNNIDEIVISNRLSENGKTLNNCYDLIIPKHLTDDFIEKYVRDHIDKINTINKIIKQIEAGK